MQFSLFLPSLTCVSYIPPPPPQGTWALENRSYDEHLYPNPNPNPDDGYDSEPHPAPAPNPIYDPPKPLRGGAGGAGQKLTPSELEEHGLGEGYVVGVGVICGLRLSASQPPHSPQATPQSLL